jgi:hypothetical protein
VLVWSMKVEPDELRPVIGSSVVMPADWTPGSARTRSWRVPKKAVVAAMSR